jgi:hypothetical protein
LVEAETRSHQDGDANPERLASDSGQEHWRELFNKRDRDRLG